MKEIDLQELKEDKRKRVKKGFFPSRILEIWTDEARLCTLLDHWRQGIKRKGKIERMNTPLTWRFSLISLWVHCMGNKQDQLFKILHNFTKLSLSSSRFGCYQARVAQALFMRVAARGLSIGKYPPNDRFASWCNGRDEDRNPIRCDKNEKRLGKALRHHDNFEILKAWEAWRLKIEDLWAEVYIVNGVKCEVVFWLLKSRPPDWR